MKQLSTLIFGLFFAINTNAQNAEAQLLFEEAETLYEKYTTMDCAKNQQGCLEVLTQMAQKVDGAEKIVGEKPKIVYLSALALYKTYDLFDYANNLYDDKHGEGLFKIVYEARKSAKRYLELKKSAELDDRYREMRKIVTELEQFPKDKATWLKEKQKRDAEIAKAKKVREEKPRQFLAQVKEYDQKKDQYYREIAPKIDAWEYKEGIKIGMDFDELKNTKKEWFKGHKTDAYGSDHRNAYKNYEKDILVDVKVDKDKKVEGYKFQIYHTKNFYKNPPRGSLQDILDDLKKYFGEHLVVERYQRTGSFYVIKSPYAKYQIIIEGNSNTACLTKTNIAHNFLYPYAFKQELLAGETAIDPAFLDRYLGIYKSGKLSYKFGREDDIPLLVLETDNNPNTYYLLLNKEKTEFVSNYYREAPGDYGIRNMTYYNDSNSFRVKFDLEAGKLSYFDKNGEEEIFTKVYE
jgi:hypothetical protein